VIERLLELARRRADGGSDALRRRVERTSVIIEWGRLKAAGATEDEIVGILVAVLPSIGADHVVSAAPGLGLALGYDVAAALEEPAGRG